MKTKNFYCLLALAAAGLVSTEAAKAQDVVYSDEAVTVTEFTCDNSNKYFSNWRQNWFLQLGAGVTQPLVEHGVDMKAPGHTVDHKMMTAVYNVGVGRWISPYLGLRLNALGGMLHWNNPTLEHPNNGWTHAKHVQLNFELMWDMCNSLGGVNPERPVSVIPFVGLGGDYLWDVQDSFGAPAAATNIARRKSSKLRTTNWSLPVSAGIQFRFRLCKYVDFFAEARASFYGDNWNLCATGDPIESHVEAVGGFNINFGGRSWDTYNECAYLSQIAALNGQVNDLRAELLNCGQTVAALQAQLPCPEAKNAAVQKDCVNAPLMTTVRFTIDSYEIMPTEEVNVYNMAEWLKANPKENVTIVGYADKDTGTAEYNLELSEKRANAVADALVNDYGIDRSRLTVKYDGSSVQPYSTNDWNRIVIFTQK
ncbi:MAG: OmpA family protein [Prevotella sp.]|nr:OmpA family protein [Bacteroides sp.]MCM1366339.1 OmpA family protein [Prevotella sp.]MCM1436303.1 OmpA family protein [Prevotella sp.]